jgi:hypothetical protein
MKCAKDQTAPITTRSLVGSRLAVQCSAVQYSALQMRVILVGANLGEVGCTYLLLLDKTRGVDSLARDSQYIVLQTFSILHSLTRER